VEREGEKERFEAMGWASLPNHKLLWHGSRLTNYVGILSQGLRIAPKEAPVTGYFLGKGVYFADIVSKSAGYCRTKKEGDKEVIGFLLLCDVALGRCFQLAHGKFIGKEDLDEAGYHSTKGCGEYGPEAGYDTEFEPGLVVPLGREKRTKVMVSELQHNEYIIYDTNPIHVRYLVKVRFNYV